MHSYEYTVVPAPSRGERAKGLKTPVERFAHALTAEINKLAGEGWEYVRAETLPTEERSGLTGRATVYHNVLVFRRAITVLAEAEEALRPDAPQPEYPVSAKPVLAPEPAPRTPQAASPKPAQSAAAPAEDTSAEATPPAPRQPSADSPEH